MWRKLTGTVLLSISSILLLISLVTDYWVVIYDKDNRAHWGLWQMCSLGVCQNINSTIEYVVLVKGCLSFSAVLNALAILVAISSFAKWQIRHITGVLVTSIFTFFTALFVLVAMAVYTSETPGMVLANSWGYSWSFILGWTALVFLISADIFLCFDHYYSSTTNYESL
ncbi:lens fiber membrane intrinsic protein-like [Microcaecilia unicolor]|uniref:Lens fiber membrane intrinsic protein-like n=1 Tax=Microcaecilia unicolor TaxID=1415580 RepID=A0A6P7YZG7_9AMPH|nr:lens fiber membrane intrinsic protein-like [Microcaecilia unicolor]